MDGTTPTTPSAPSPAPSSGAPTARRSPRPPATSFAGLIDVLDRVDGPAGGAGRRRLAAHRSAAPGAPGGRPATSRPNGFRATATRTVPLRSVQPAPMARRPAGVPVVEPGSYWDMTRPPAPAAPEPMRTLSRRAALIRRAAMWGAGPGGENLAWRTSIAPPAAARPPLAATPAAPPAAFRGPWLRTLVRRMALWGSGVDGEHLAWRVHSVPVAAVRRLDPPVVLREMPSTPLIQPAATSPAAALVPAAAPLARPIGPVLPPVTPVGWVAPAHAGPPTPSGWPAPPTGWPQPPEWPPSRLAGPATPAPPAAPASTASQVSTPYRWAAHPPQTFPAVRFPAPSPRERGLARARGDPLSPPPRGSPPRRPHPSTPSARLWSQAASVPAPRPAPPAPG